MKNKITKNTLLLLIGQIGTLGLNMVTVVLLARYWGEYLFGIFSYSLIFVGLFAILPDFGMKPVLVREISRNRAKADVIVYHALGLKTVLAVVSMVLACLSAIILFPDIQLRMAIAVLSFTIFFSSKVGTIRIALESIFYADMEMKYPVIFQLVDSILQVLTIGILIILKATFFTILIGFVLANIPGLILTIMVSSKKLPIKLSLNREKICWLVKESFPLLMYLSLTMIYERLDVLFLKSFHGESQVGIYSSAFRLTAPLAFIPYAIATALYPMMSKQYHEKDIMLFKCFSIGLKVLLLIGVVMGAFGTLLGKPIFALLFGKRYYQAIVPFQLLLWSQTIMFLTYFMADYNNSQNKQNANLVYMMIMLVLSFFFQRFFIMKYGILGAAWAKIILNTMGLSAIFLISMRHLSKEQIVQFYKISAIVICFLVMICLSFLWEIHCWMQWLLYCAAVCICIAWLFSNDEKRLLKDTMHALVLQPHAVR